MKKLFSFMLISMVVIGMGYAQGITVDEPASGVVWCKGQRYEIKWTVTVTMDPKVKIRLFDSASSTKILDIVDDTANDGSYFWTVPSTIDSGSYVIRVKTLDNTVSDDSGVFQIKFCADLFRVKLPRLSMSAAELAIFMHGPGPRIRNFGRLRGLLSKYGLKSLLNVMLLRNGEPFLNLGNYRPRLGEGGGVFFNTIPDELVLKLNRKQLGLLQTGKNFELVLMTKGKAFARTKIGFEGQRLQIKKTMR